MKKALLILSLFFIGISSSYAWTQVGMSAYGFDQNWDGIEVTTSYSVNINSTCDVLIFRGNLGSQNLDSYFAFDAYDYANNFSYNIFMTYGQGFYQGFTDLYFGTLNMYLTTYHAYVTAVLEY